MRFHVVTYGVKQAEQHLEQIASRTVNARPAFEEIYLTILDIEHEAFDNEGARSGFSKWTKLTINTIIHKAKKSLSSHILQESERLYGAMTTYRSPDAYVRIEKDKIVFAPKLPYGRIHQKGGITGGFTAGSVVPARPYVRFSQTDANAFGREIMRHVMGRGRSGSIGVNYGA